MAEAAQRMRTKLGMYNSFNLPHPLRILRNAAGNRRTKLLFLPNGMSKRVKNQSRYDQRYFHLSCFIYRLLRWNFLFHISFKNVYILLSGRSLYLGQLNGVFTQQILFYTTTGKLLR